MKKIITFDPLIYTIDHPKFNNQTRKKNPLVQGFHRLEKSLNLEDFLENSLKIKNALKSTGKSRNSLEKSLKFSIFCRN